jgi:hypothetical protein
MGTRFAGILGRLPTRVNCYFRKLSAWDGCNINVLLPLGRS